MGWLTAIKNFVIGAPQIATDVFDKDNGILVKAGGFINDLHYSDVEKARDAFKVGEAVTEFVKMSLAESTVKSKTRRFLAMMWIRVQLALILMVAICIPFNPEWAKTYFELATCNLMMWGTGSIICFFFGAYVWGTYIKGKKA